MSPDKKLRAVQELVRSDTTDLHAEIAKRLSQAREDAKADAAVLGP